MRVLVVLPLLVLAACAPEPAPPAEPAPAAEPAGPPVVRVQSGTELVEALDALEAEAVVLNVWATWCGPCVVEFPHFVRYAAEQAEARAGAATGGVHVRFVSTDAPRDSAAVLDFLREQNVTDPSFHHVGPGDIVTQLAPFAGGAIPVTMILDGGGIVRDTHIGIMSYDELAAAVAAVRGA